MAGAAIPAVPASVQQLWVDNLIDSEVLNQETKRQVLGVMSEINGL